MSIPQDPVDRNRIIASHENPLQFPGSIQPHGVLLALSRELEIFQVSNNTATYLGLQPQELLGQHLGVLLKREQIEVIREHLGLCLSGKGETLGDRTNPLKLVIESAINPVPTAKQHIFDCMVHQIEDVIILELEPTDSRSEMSFFAFQSLTAEMITKMQKRTDVNGFLQVVASEFQRIIDFDRVMVYQFDHDGSGCVLAEAKKADFPTYLGLHYPATDIPDTSRELYLNCPLRFVANISAAAVPLISLEHFNNSQANNSQANNSQANNSQAHIHSTEPINLSLSVLRSIDSCGAEFHQNMGVKSLLVLPIIRHQLLWGLISCHNYTPKYVTCEVRKICEYLGQIIVSELTNKINQSASDYQAKLKSLQSDFIESISQSDNFIDALIHPEIRLLDVVNAMGAAVILGNEITLVGATPSQDEVRNLANWADSYIENNLFFTNSLPQLYPAAEIFKNTASGLLMLRISQLRRYYILWFRPEVLQTVNWAGNPQDSIQIKDDGSVVLSPRQSFNQWQEIVQFTSLPWQECEISSALDLRNAIVGIVLNKADELAAMNLELERSNRELASFAFAASHDLKEPLRGIHNYSTILLEDYAHLLDEEGLDCLQTLIGLSQRMDNLIDVLLQISQLGQAQIKRRKTDLNKLVKSVIEVIRISRQDEELNIHIPRKLPEVECDPTLINEVFSNLIINAFKYNENQEKWVEIGYLNKQEQLKRFNKLLIADIGTNIGVENPSIVFYVKDNGIGIQEHHLEIIFRLFKRLHSQEKFGGGAGAGLAITKKIIERHHGKIWVESIHKQGSTFYFTLQ